MEPVDLLPNPPHCIGPTWQKTVDGGWHLPEHTLGWGILNWLATYVRSPDGEGPFLPTLEQARFLLWLYAVNENGSYLYRDIVFRRCKGAGKDPLGAAIALAELCGPVAFAGFDAEGQVDGKPRHAAWVQIVAVSQEQPLALDTEVPTPSGWTTIGELSVGDYVIGSDGVSHRVERETPVLTGLDCYRVSFDDGTQVVASASHGWTTQRLNGHGDQYEEVTISTAELAESVRGSKGRKRHRIPVAGYDSPEVELGLDPWFLGMWLGDGFSADSGVTFQWSLKAEYESLVKPLVGPNQSVVWTELGGDTGTFRIKNNDRADDKSSVRNKLRQEGVLNNKHIPSSYMLSGTEQRRELMRGMVDSDGGVDANGRAYFVNTNRGLVYRFQELAVSLGFRCTVRKHGDALRAEFNPGDGFPVAKLAYKYSRQTPYNNRCRSQHRWVESVEKVDSVPVKCIGIDTEDHLFQVSKSRILTHNTKNTMSLFPVMVSAKLKEDYNLEVNKTIIYSEAGGRIEAVTSSPYSMEGNRPTLVICNETQWWHEANDGHNLAGVIEGNVTKIPNSRRLSICNAHIPGEDSVAERDYDYWQAVESGQAVDVSTLYDALEAPADTPVSEIPSEREDPEGYAAGVEKLREGVLIARGDSDWLPVDAIVESVLDVKNPITESRRKFLNQVNASEDSWIAPYEWDACTHPVELGKGERITLGFDGSKSNDWTALVACRVEDGALFLIKAWNPKKYPNEEVPRDDVDATVRNVFSAYDVVGFRADVREFESYVDGWTKDFHKKMKVKATPGHAIAFDMRGNTKKFALDCERFLDAVLEQELSHDGNTLLRQHVLNAKRYPTQYDSISIRKASKDSSRKIDAAVCAVLAWGARHEYLISNKYRTRKAVVIS